MIPHTRFVHIIKKHFWNLLVCHVTWWQIRSHSNLVHPHRDRFGMGLEAGAKCSPRFITRLKNPISTTSRAVSFNHCTLLAKCPANSEDKPSSNLISALWGQKLTITHIQPTSVQKLSATEVQIQICTVVLLLFLNRTKCHSNLI